MRICALLFLASLTATCTADHRAADLPYGSAVHFFSQIPLHGDLSMPHTGAVATVFIAQDTLDIDRSLSPAERALLRAFHSALSSPEVRRVMADELRRQIRYHPPLAFIEGQWASPIDLLRILGHPIVARALEGAAPAEEDPEAARALLANRMRERQLVAVAFTTEPDRSRVGLPFVGSFPRIQSSTTSRGSVLIVPIKDAEWAINEYLPPGISESDAEPPCYYFCGDPDTWDFDADGRPNDDDDDDDADGVQDLDDAFPYSHLHSRPPSEHRQFIGFTDKFSLAAARTVISARGSIATGRTEKIGRVTDEVDAQFVFPAPLEIAEPDCPEKDDAATRYVSTDSQGCAVVRFVCRAGEQAFFSDCGCGCRSSGSPE